MDATLAGTNVRNPLRRLAAFAAATVAALGAMGGLGGCSTEELNRSIDAERAAIAELREAADRAEAIADEAAAMIDEAGPLVDELPDAVRPEVAEALAWARSVLDAAPELRRRFDAEFAAREAKIADAQARLDEIEEAKAGFWETADVIATWFGIPGAGLISAVVTSRRSRRKGVAQGAAEVAASIESGKAISSTLRTQFTADGPAAMAMKAFPLSPAARAAIEDAKRRAKASGLATPTTPAPPTHTSPPPPTPTTPTAAAA